MSSIYISKLYFMTSSLRPFCVKNVDGVLVSFVVQVEMMFEHEVEEYVEVPPEEEESTFSS